MVADADTRRVAGLLEGVRLTLVLCLAVALLSAAVLGVAGTGEPGLRLWVHVTARLGATLLAAVYIASTLRRVWRSPASAWLLRNRRYLGLGFAFTHFTHLASVIWLSEVLDKWPSVAILVLTAIGYTALLALVVTSTDAAVARMGRRNWSLLHTWTLHYLWFLFVFTFAGVVAKRPDAVLFLAMLLGALGFRIWGRPGRRRAAAPAA